MPNDFDIITHCFEQKEDIHLHWIADALLVAHSHKPMISQPNKILIDTHNNRVTVKPFKVIVASSWLSYGGYAVRKQLLPTSHAPQIITLSARHDRKKITVTM